jgi:hypothetical protein
LFTLMFPERDRTRQRRLEEAGVVELTSASGYFWMRGYVFVLDHPYATRTDGQGAFVLPHVPAGRYEAVCWLPSWEKERHERDPETGDVTRLHFRRPIEREITVEVPAGGASRVEFAMGR